MTIQEIKYLVELHDDKNTHFFSRSSMRFFGQKLSDFKVKVQSNEVDYIISAPIRNDVGRVVGETKRRFNSQTNTLHYISSTEQNNVK